MAKKLKRKAASAADVPPAKKAKSAAPSASPSESPTASPKTLPDASPKTKQPLAASLSSEAGKFPKKLKAKKRRKLGQATAANAGTMPQTSPAVPLKGSSDAAPEASLDSESSKFPKKLKAKKRKKKEALPKAATDKEEEVAQKTPKGKQTAAKEKGKSAAQGVESSKEHTQIEDKNHLKVFIGGIPFNTDLETLKADFEECGELQDFVYPKDDEGRFKGIAFATYKTKQSVEEALTYDGSDYGGRVLKVAMATPRRSSGNDKGGKGGGKDKGKGKSKGEKGSKAKAEKGKKGTGKNDGKSKGKGKGKGNKNTKTGSEGKKKFGFELSSEED